MAATKRVPFVYVTVFERHESLVQLFEDFGFSWISNTKLGERVYAKSVGPPRADEKLDPFEVVRTHYPCFAAGASVRKFIVPVRPEFHSRLFPETRNRQFSLREFAEAVPEGNTIRKAYRSHSSTKLIERGSLLF